MGSFCGWQDCPCSIHLSTGTGWWQFCVRVSLSSSGHITSAGARLPIQIASQSEQRQKHTCSACWLWALILLQTNKKSKFPPGFTSPAQEKLRCWTLVVSTHLKRFLIAKSILLLSFLLTSAFLSLLIMDALSRCNWRDKPPQEYWTALLSPFCLRTTWLPNDAKRVGNGRNNESKVF